MDDRDYHDLANDKDWASKYILGPLYDPEPNQVCASSAPQNVSASSASVRAPSTPRWARGSRFSGHGDQPLVLDDDDSGQEPSLIRRLMSRSKGDSQPQPPPRAYQPMSSTRAWNQGTIMAREDSTRTSMLFHKHRRTVSLPERFPGDESNRPLAILTREYQAAEERPLSRKRISDHPPAVHEVQEDQVTEVVDPDKIDYLDMSAPIPGLFYHHGGPYDAAQVARKRSHGVAVHQRSVSYAGPELEDLLNGESAVLGWRDDLIVEEEEDDKLEGEKRPGPRKRKGSSGRGKTLKEKIKRRLNVLRRKTL